MRLFGSRLFAVIFFLIGTCAYASNGDYSLILAAFGKDSSGEQTQTLTRFRFSRGQLVRTENIFTARTSEVRFDLGENTIYRNRYVITSWGDVIDVSSGQLLFKSKGELAGIDSHSNKVVVRVDRVDEEGVFEFDITSREYRRTRQPGIWEVEGVLSPNGQLVASGHASEITIHYQNERAVSVGKRFWRHGTDFCSSTATPTFAWLDDSHLVTQKGNGRLVVVGLDGHVEPLVTIPDVVSQACGPTIHRDLSNNIYYEAREQTWRIDPTKHTFETYSYQPVGHDFEIEYGRNPTYGSIVRFRGREIGKFWCDDLRTAPGHIALAFGPVGSNLGYPEGVKVWSEQSNTWTTLKPNWLTAIVGWIEE